MMVEVLERLHVEALRIEKEYIAETYEDTAVS